MAYAVNQGRQQVPVALGMIEQLQCHRTSRESLGEILKYWWSPMW